MGCDLHDGGIGGMGVSLLLIKVVLRLIDRLTNDICSIRYSGASADGCNVIKYRVLWELMAFVFPLLRLSAGQCSQTGDATFSCSVGFFPATSQLSRYLDNLLHMHV